MTNIEIRKLIIDALKYANVHGIQNNAQVSGFLSGEGDVNLSSLDMDSLATMELFIAIELNCGVSIVPETLLTLNTLSDLAQKISDEQRT